MLDTYSTQALAAFQQLLPDLAAQAVERGNSFTISTTFPSGFELWISSDNQEMTVGFAEHHTHFGWHEGNSLDDVAEAVKYVKKLRAGVLEVFVRYKSADFASSGTLDVGQSIPPLTWVQRWLRRKQRQEIRRWA